MQRKSTSKAFSLVEVSIVLLIIGVLIAATISARVLIKNSRIASAQSKTRAAPVNSIPNATIWLESSLETSFAAEESADGETISGWGDIKSGSAQEDNSATPGGAAPIYSNTINGIQAVKFTDTDGTFLNIKGQNIVNSDYTIFILEKRQGAGANYFLGDPDTLSTSGLENETLILGYSASGKVIHSQGETNKYESTISDYSSNAEIPRLFTFTQNASTGKKTYINGYLAGESANTDQLTTLPPLSSTDSTLTLNLGKGYTGEIGEFIIFDRALRNEERTSIEKYIVQKWRMKNVDVTANAASGCVGGTVTASGCDASCVVSITGSTGVTIGAGSSSTIACNATGYTGETTASYTCGSGSVLTPTPDASQCIADNGCAAGYTAISGECVLGCTITAQDGLASDRDVGPSDTLTSISCDAGYSGGIAYTCSAGTASDIVNSCECADGYLLHAGTCQKAFVSVWKTDNTGGVSATNQVKLPLLSGGNYNFTVYWDEGDLSKKTENVTSDITYSYGSAGTYTIQIVGTFEGLNLNNQDDTKLLDISQWGPVVFQADSSSMFKNATNLTTISALDAPDTSSVTTMNHMFNGCSSLATIPGLGSWDTSSVTSMNSMFYNTPVFNEPSVSNLDVSSVTNISGMFQYSSLFNQNLNSWNTSNVTLAAATFRAAYAFNGDIRDWDVSNLTNAQFMFSPSAFNQDISGWETDSLTSTRYMFANSPFNQDVSSWNYDNITTMQRMFENNNSFSTDNYNKLLIALAGMSSIPSTINFSGTTATHSGSAADAAITTLESNGWTVD